MTEETTKQRQERLMAECLRDAKHLRIRGISACEPPRTDISLEIEDGNTVALEIRGLTVPARR